MTLPVRRLLWFAAAAAACGSRPPSPRDLPPLTELPGEGSAAAVPTVAPAPVATQGGMAALVAAVGTRPLVVDEVTSLRLNAVERRRAQQVIATWASAAGFTIVPPARVEDAIDRAAEGVDPTTGKACGPALDRTYAMERWVVPMGAQGKITARVRCRAECVLQLELLVFGQGMEFYAAPFDPGQPWETELGRRLGELTDNGGHDRHGHGNNPVTVAGVARAAGAADWYLDEGAYAQRRADAEAKVCGVAAAPVALLLERDDHDGVRCERAAMRGDVTEYDAKVNACMCALAVQRERPTVARSYLVYASPAPFGRPRTRNGLEISASILGGDEDRPEGSAPWFLRDGASIEACFIGRTDEVKSDEAGATLAFDAHGVVAKVTIADGAGLLRPDERACITRKLMTIRTPCPRSQTEVGTARLTLAIHPPYGAK